MPQRPSVLSAGRPRKTELESELLVLAPLMEGFGHLLWEGKSVQNSSSGMPQSASFCQIHLHMQFILNVKVIIFQTFPLFS